MYQKFVLFFILLSVSISARELNKIEGDKTSWTSMFALPEKTINNRFEQVHKEIEYRWNNLTKELNFPTYLPNLDENMLVEEFYTLHNLRIQLWLDDCISLPCLSSPYFQVCQELLQADRYRQPCCITFDHSVADASYNASCIQIGKRRFFALEGPLEEHVPFFFRLLMNWSVASVVCLTDETDTKGFPKCAPYWKDRIIQQNNLTFLRVPIEGEYNVPSKHGFKDLPFLFWQDWEDHHGVDSQRLVEAADQVRNNVSEHEIIAVHCSAGVGRTGTFIATICLLDKIDEQLSKRKNIEDIELNISELFLYLNFHRPWLVAKPSQYITLYRTVEWYLHQKNEKNN